MSDKEEHNDPLSDAFGVESEPIEEVSNVPVLPGKVDEYEKKYEEYVDADYEFARENIMNTILKAQDALNKMIDLAGASQHPRAFEVVGGLVNTIVASNKDLLDLAKKNKELRKVEAETPVTAENITQNNMYIGSTAEFLNMLQQNGIQTDVKEIILNQYKKKDDLEDGSEG